MQTAQWNHTLASRLCQHGKVYRRQLSCPRRQIGVCDVVKLGCPLYRDTRHRSQQDKAPRWHFQTCPTTLRRSFGSGRTTRQNSEKEPPPNSQIEDEKTGKPRLLDTTRAIRQKVKERFSNLTPHENIYNVPNILTVSRLIATPVIGYLVLHDQHVWAVGLFAYAGFTDLIDGWVARKWNLQTVAGSVIDPMADKFLMTVLVGCLAAKGALPLWLAIIIFGRDMSLGFSAIYYRYASLPAPKTFMRYWDFSIPSAEVHPTTVSKWNTFLQLGLIGATVTLPLLTDNILPGALSATDLNSAVKAMQYVVAGTTLWSGASYLWTKDAVRILGTDEEMIRKQGIRGRMVLGISFALFLALAIDLRRRERDSDRELARADHRPD